MSSESSAAKEPKRARGIQRVAVLLDAGAALFLKKGYEATTMTEIAAQAGASIGSLYQFFPSKQALAEALFDRYSQHIALALSDISARARTWSSTELADRLVDLKLQLRADRDATIAANDAIAGTVERRKPLRDATRECLAKMLRSRNPDLSDEAARVAAVTVSHIMHMVRTVEAEDSPTGQQIVAETRKLLALYLDSMATKEKG